VPESPAVEGWLAIQSLLELVSTQTFSHCIPSMSVSRRKPAPKWGTTKVTSRKRLAAGMMSSGLA
jgi:hypothetical protein